MAREAEPFPRLDLVRDQRRRSRISARQLAIGLLRKNFSRRPTENSEQ
jgi:hypothetical protein